MDRLVFLLYRAVAALLRLLPLIVVWRLGRALGSLGYVFGVPYRRLAIHNLAIAFGDEKSAAERRAIAREHFASLGANFLSGVKIAALSRERIRMMVEIDGLDHVANAHDAGRGVIMVISHIGNWELFAQLYPVLFACPLGTIYQRLGNPHIDAAVREDRARLGLQLFERKEGFQGTMKMLRGPSVVGVLIDQHAGDAGVWCPLFGRLASTTSLAAMLALRTGAALISAAVHSAGPGRWRLVVDAPVPATERDADTLTARLNLALETQIRRVPADWFWVHNRWKTPRPKFLLATYKRGVAGAATKPFRIAIRSTNWLGDAVMTIPAVRAIKRGRPDAHVTILAPAKLADLWRTVVEVDDIIPIERDETVFDVARKLRDRFDAAILFPSSVRSALEAWLARIPRRVGYAGHRRSWLLNQVFREKKSKKPSAPRHQVHHYLALAEHIGADVSTDHRSPVTDHRSPVTDHLPRIGLVPGAEYGPAKRWLPERFAEVMRAIPAEWVIFGVEKDREVADAILAELRSPSTIHNSPPTLAPPTDRVGNTTLAELIAELRKCDLLLTNDTGTMHLAASLGVPVVAIFGSTEPALTGPLGEGHTVLRHHVECSPCFLRECPIDFRCMKGVEVSEVVSAIETKLSELRG
ncbi:MAG: lipopolysaccharide heptosyltransferase II [Chthoniobacteraceae bacterium]